MKMFVDLKIVPAFLYQNNDEIEAVVVSENVKKISNCAFSNCKNLKQMEFLNNADDWRNHLATDFDGTLLDDDALFKTKIERFVFHKQPLNFHRYFENMSWLDEIVVLDDKLAIKYWQETLSKNPRAFLYLDSKHYQDKQFRGRCIDAMRKRYEVNFGAENAGFFLNSVLDEKAAREKSKGPSGKGQGGKNFEKKL